MTSDDLSTEQARRVPAGAGNGTKQWTILSLVLIEQVAQLGYAVGIH